MNKIAFRDDVDRMSIAELKRYIGDLELRIDTLQGSVKTTEISNLMRAFGLTQKEAILVASMRDGAVHTKDGLLNAIYWAGTDDPPEIKIIDVFVCKARKKLVGSGVDIGTQWGVGYFVVGVDALHRAMSGEHVPRTENRRAPHGRAPGDKPRRRHGEIRDAALAYLRSLPRSNDLLSVDGAAMYAAVGVGQSASVMLSNLAHGGYVKILNARRRTYGAPYLVRLT